MWLWQQNLALFMTWQFLKSDTFTVAVSGQIDFQSAIQLKVKSLSLMYFLVLYLYFVDVLTIDELSFSSFQIYQ